MTKKQKGTATDYAACRSFCFSKFALDALRIRESVTHSSQLWEVNSKCVRKKGEEGEEGAKGRRQRTERAREQETDRQTDTQTHRDKQAFSKSSCR